MVKLKEIPIIFVYRIKSYIFNWYIEYIILLRIVKVIIVYVLKCEGLPRVYRLSAFGGTFELIELVESEDSSESERPEGSSDIRPEDSVPRELIRV